jgi:hypothetical protein
LGGLNGLLHICIGTIDCDSVVDAIARFPKPARAWLWVQEEIEGGLSFSIAGVKYLRSSDVHNGLFLTVDGSNDGDHDKESKRRSCDARLLGEDQGVVKSYAIQGSNYQKPIARILELMQCVARGAAGKCLHTSKRA